MYSMTTMEANEKLKTAATLWQLITGVVIAIVSVSVFAFAMKRDIVQNRIDFEKTDREHDDEIKQLQNSQKEDHNESIRKQDQILDKLYELRVLMEGKQDRKN